MVNCQKLSGSCDLSANGGNVIIVECGTRLHTFQKSIVALETNPQIYLCIHSILGNIRTTCQNVADVKLETIDNLKIDASDKKIGIFRL